MATLAAEAELGVHLESDWFYRWIVAGFIPPHEPASKDQNTVVMHAVIDAAATYADGGFDVFWDGVVGPWWIGEIRARFEARGHRLTYVVLRPEKRAALDRVAERDGSSVDNTGAAVMHDQFSDLGSYERFVLPTDSPLEQVVSDVRSAIGSGQFRLED